MDGRALSAALAAILAAACDAGPGASDAGADADLPDPGLVVIPWLARGGPPIAPSPEHACPDGFRAERTDTGVLSCRPWPEGGPASCTGALAHFPGEPGCARVGTACPAGDFPEGLPTDRPIVYVRAGAAGGDGTMARPYGSVGFAVSVAPRGAVVAVGKGTYDDRVDLFSDVTVWGACPEETILTRSSPSEADTVVGAFIGDGELRNLTIRAPVTMGVYIDMGVSVRIADVLIDGASGYGMYLTGVGTQVTLEGVIVRGVTTFPSGNGGVGVQVVDGANASARRISIERSAATSLVVAFESVGTFERVALRDATGDAPSVRPGTAMAVQENGEATLSASGVWGHPAGGLLAALGSRLTVMDVAIEEAANGTSIGAPALEARVGSTLTGSFVWVEGARGGAVVAAEDGAFVLSDLVVRDTRPADDLDRAGVAMSLEGESSARLERVLVERSRRGGIITRPGARLVATDLVVRDTEPSGPRNLGSGMVLFGVENVLERVVIDRSTLLGLAVSEGVATLRDVVVRGTRGEPDVGVYGRGLEVNLGAVLTGDRVVLEQNREVSFFVVDPGSSARIANLYIRDSLGQECGEACPEGQQYGYGLSVRDEARVELDGFVITRSRLLGLQVAEGGAITGVRGEVSEAVIGINIQDPEFDLVTALPGIVFRDNDRNVDAMFLPLPDPGLSGEL